MPARSWSATRPAGSRPRHGLDWPGRGEGLTDRESEILALITQGMSNAEVADADLPQPEHRQVLHPERLPQDRASTSRTQAVLWGVEHGFAPDHHRIRQRQEH